MVRARRLALSLDAALGQTGGSKTNCGGGGVRFQHQDLFNLFESSLDTNMRGGVHVWGKNALIIIIVVNFFDEQEDLDHLSVVYHTRSRRST